MHTPKWIFGEGRLFLSLFSYFARYLTAVVTQSNFSSQRAAVYPLLISVHCLPQKKKMGRAAELIFQTQSWGCETDLFSTTEELRSSVGNKEEVPSLKMLV